MILREVLRSFVPCSVKYKVTDLLRLRLAGRNGLKRVKHADLFEPMEILIHRDDLRNAVLQHQRNDVSVMDQVALHARCS